MSSAVYQKLHELVIFQQWRQSCMKAWITPNSILVKVSHQILYRLPFCLLGINHCLQTSTTGWRIVLYITARVHWQRDLDLPFLSLRVSVTVFHIDKLIWPFTRGIIQVFWATVSLQNSKWNILSGGVKYTAVRKIAIFDRNGRLSRNSTRWAHSYYGSLTGSQVPDRSMSVPMTLSRFETRVAGGPFFRRSPYVRSNRLI